MKKTFVTINIPNDAKKTGESNEEAFLRIIDTWTGEYEHTWMDFTRRNFEDWRDKYSEGFKGDTFPCAWEEDETGNIVRYYVYEKAGNTNHLKHETVEI